MSATRPLSPLRRRGFLKIVAFGGLATGLGAAALRRFGDTTARVSQVLMGTIVNLAVVSDDRARSEAAVALAVSEMNRLIAVFDYRQPASALGRLNAAGALTDPSPELVAVLSHAQGLSALTHGAFDVSVKPVLDAFAAGQFDAAGLRELVDYRQIQVEADAIRLGRPGMSLTLDGLAKGRVVDGAVDALRRAGFGRVYVEAGGDLAVSGSGAAGTAWQIGVRKPRGRADQLAARFSVTQGAVATSGDYLNAFTVDRSVNHLIDPRTLQSPSVLASATALAPTAMEADALSTALMVLGPTDGLALVDSLPGVEALLIGKDDQQYASTGFSKIGAQ